MNTDLVNIIFGMKIRQARLECKLSLSEFAEQCDLSASYITEIEKGRKYPKTDKIMKMAEVLGKEYDALVSIKLAPSLTSLETLLASHLLQKFPFEEFGLEVNNLVNLFTRTPNRASALARTILEIGRQYDMKGEHFLRAALRAYQELHENYFPEIEEAALEFAKQYQLEQHLLSPQTLQNRICQEFGYDLDMTQLACQPALANYRSVYIPSQKPKLLLNPALRACQIKFLLAREMGYQFLNLTERANISAPNRVDSFQQVLNDFKASYFAGALLMPQADIVTDLQAFFQLDHWQPAQLWEMLKKYDVSPEMLLYRFSELVPQFFGIKLHFLRFNNANGGYQLIKQLNMNQLLLPSGTALDEHHCRRWLAVRLLRQMATMAQSEQFSHLPLVGVQSSKFLESEEQVFSFGFARPLALSPEVSTSVTIGFTVTPELRATIRFVDDPTIPTTTINETCERCPLTWAECQERDAEPVIFKAKQREAAREAALHELIMQLQE